MFKRTFCLLSVMLCFVLSAGFQAEGSQSQRGSRKAPIKSQAVSTTPAQIALSIHNIGRNLQGLLSRAGLAPNRSPNQSSLSSRISLELSQRAQLTIPDVGNVNVHDQKVVWSKTRGVPIEILVGGLQRRQHPSLSSMPDPVSAAQAFLVANRALLQIKDPISEFTLMSMETDREGVAHVRFKQMYKGIDVWAKDIYVHVNSQGQVVMFNGTYATTPDLVDLSPRISGDQAIEAALNDLSVKKEPISLPPQLAPLTNYKSPIAKEVIWYDKSNLPHLVWFVEVVTQLDHDWYYFIDASNGSVLHRYNNVDNDGPTLGSGTDLNGVTRTFGTYQVGSTYYMIDASEPMFNSQASQIPKHPVGAITTLDLRQQDLSAQSTFSFVTSSGNVWNDPSSVSAQYNAEQTYNFYRTTFGRNSIDGNGMTINSIVHVTENGQPMDNANWNQGFQVMCYGDGNIAFKPLAGGLDVAAHEMTHGVTSYTANLVYEDQSGALNESVSDAFACLVDSSNWTIGEQIIRDYMDFPTGALRDLANPHNGGTPGSRSWQPENMSEFVNTTHDNGGVHKNSGIPNHAFYLVATKIGRQKAGAIWYKALTHYLTSSAQFVDARIATEGAASELYGSSSPEVSAVKAAWDSVQVYETAPTPPPPVSQLVGQNWILAVNTSQSDPNSIYMAKPVVQTNSDLSPLSQTPVLTRPAVSDTSGLVLFVGTDYRLYGLVANAQNPGEVVLDTDAVWWSVAVGPGLNSIALTSRFVDTTVYYIDFKSNQSKIFKITSPSYDGSNTHTVLYASSLSFDPTGRYILLDAYNQVVGTLADTISFWNIDLLDVTTGRIQTVFSQQPQGIDLANPSFSKTSLYRFAFDYWNDSTQRGYVLAANFYDGSVGQVAGPLLTLGYPTYSSDDTVIAFHTLEYQNAAWHHAIQKMPLDPSSLNGLGTPEEYLIDATYPVWFVIGSRVTGVRENPPQSVPDHFVLFQNYPNPFNPTTMISYQLPANSFVTLKVYDVLGREVEALVNGRQSAGSHSVQFDAAGLPSGVYFYRLEAGNFTETKRMLLLK